MTRILFFLKSLSGGGAERTVLNVVNHLDRTRFEPVLALSSASGPYMSLLRDDVRVEELGGSRVRYGIWALARAIRRLRPALAFATLQQGNVALQLAAALSVTGVRTVLRESNYQSLPGVRRPWARERAVRWAYGRASHVVALSNGVNEDLRARYGVSAKRVVTIYNPVEIEEIGHLAAAEPEGGAPPPGGGFHVVGAGRLTRQKGFDLLIRALARLDAVPWRLTLLGDGPDRGALEDLARTLGVGERVSMPGFVDNPYAWMARADLFVLSSRWEGFGHVIVEAMACGTAVLATRCPAGPDEIITDGVDGRLCAPDSVEALAQALEALAGAPEERRRLAEAARSSCRRFDVAVIVPEYERLFESVAGGSA